MTVSVARVLDALGVKAQLVGRRWWAEQCPMPRHGPQNPAHRWKNFFVRHDEHDHAGQFYCYSCKSAGRLSELVVALRGCTYREAIEWLAGLDDGRSGVAPYLRVRVVPEQPAGHGFRLPPEVEAPPWPEWVTPPRRYLEGRGVTPDQVARWRIGYALSGRLQGRIVMPIHGAGGRLASYSARTFADDETRYLAPSERERGDTSAFWGEHLWPAPDERATLIVVEGILNGLTFDRLLRGAGWEGVHLGAMQGSEFDHRKSLKLRGWRRIITATDPDRAGDRVAASVEASRRGSPCRVDRFRYPIPGKDACETPPETLLDALSRSLVGTTGAGSPGATA